MNPSSPNRQWLHCKFLSIIFWKYFEQLFGYFNSHQSKNEAPTWQKSSCHSRYSLECKTLDNEKPNIHALSHTIYLACLSTISFTFDFDTISSQDADFGLPDLRAFSIDSNPESNFFFHLLTMSYDTLVDQKTTEISAEICFKEQPILERVFM